MQHRLKRMEIVRWSKCDEQVHIEDELRRPDPARLEYDKEENCYSSGLLVVPAYLFARGVASYAQAHDVELEEAYREMLCADHWNVIEGVAVYRIGQRTGEMLVWTEQGYSCAEFEVEALAFGCAVCIYMAHFGLSRNAATWHLRELSQWYLTETGPAFYI